MKSALEFLFESENAGNIVAFLGGRGPRAHIVAPAWVRDRVGKGTSQARHSASWSDDGSVAAELPDTVTNIIVVAEDAEREGAIVSSLAARKGQKVYGLFGHVLPCLLCAVNGMSPGFSLEGLKRYAILCIPRSGSRYLSAVLSNRGVGAPREHIREPMAHAIAEGRLGFAEAIEALERFGQKNGIFGTKLISTFILRASHRQVTEVAANLVFMVERGYRLMHLDRPLNDAVISSYIAYRMRKWHFFGAMDEDTRAKLDSLDFEDGAAWDEYIRYRAEKAMIGTLVRELDIPTIRYSTIETDIDDAVADVCARIGVEPARLKPGSAAVPIPTRNQSPTYAMFTERLSALLKRRAGDIDAATVKKLRAIGKLAQQDAEGIVAEMAVQD